MDLGRWNVACSSHWNRLRGELRREFGSDLAFWRGVEVQDGKRRADGAGRGALHLHVLVWSSSPLRLGRVRELAVRCGFGHSVAVDHCPVDADGQRRFVRYASKYVSKASDQRPVVPWVVELLDPSTGELVEGSARATYRTWSASRGWGFSMRQMAEEIARANAVRAARAALVAAGLMPAGFELVWVADAPATADSDPPGGV